MNRRRALSALLLTMGAALVPTPLAAQTASVVLRTYVEGFDARWGRHDTTTELMAKLVPTRAPGSAEALRVALRTAEAVKFGTRRPDHATAAADLHDLRGWVQRSGPAGDARADTVAGGAPV